MYVYVCTCVCMWAAALSFYVERIYRPFFNPFLSLSLSLSLVSPLEQEEAEAAWQGPAADEARIAPRRLLPTIALTAWAAAEILAVALLDAAVCVRKRAMGM
jgi:hypothetical protein